MSAPHIAVVIPTHNRSWSLSRAIRSVLAQSFETYELIVVDDGSTDSTRELLSMFEGRVRALHQENRGVSAARNAGVKESRAPWIAFLDSDDEWLPEKLQAQVEYLEANPDLRICQTLERWIRRGRFVNIPNTHQKRGGDIFRPSLRKCMITCSSVMMQRTLFEQCGGFNQTLPACEDYDLWLRIARNHQVGLLPKIHLNRYGGHADQLSSRWHGNDRYRIRALLTLLTEGGLTPSQTRMTIDELIYKCDVFGKGCLKRGKNEVGKRFLALARSYLAENRGDSLE